MSLSASTTPILQMSSYMDSHTVYPVVCKNFESKSWRDCLRSVILKLSTILNAATHDSKAKKKQTGLDLETLTMDTLTKALPSAKVKHFASQLRLLAA